MHCDIFAHPIIESLWRIILSATAGVPVESYRPTHNMNHHVHLGLLRRETSIKALQRLAVRYTQHGDHLDTKQMKYNWHLLNLVLFFPTVP